ncbi:MAG: TonB-dependent receptor, partial [Acidobacteria bacterium]|nr:TonB-dependent receptor [Acidobacteriota bacterium]
ALVPLPNQGDRLVIPVEADQDDHQFLVRIDHSFSMNHRINGRYFLDQFEFERDTGSPPGILGLNRFRNQSVTIRSNHTLNPSLVLSFLVNYERHNRFQFGQTPATMQDFGVKVPLARPDIGPGMRVFVPGAFNLFSAAPINHFPATLGWQASMFHSRGKHTLQFGFDAARTEALRIDGATHEGQWDFSGQRTSTKEIPTSGLALADFLLGLPATFTQGSGRRSDLRESQYDVWIQDDWKIHPRLTLNFGLRWEPWLPPVEINDVQAGWGPGRQSVRVPDAPVGLLYPGDPGVPRSLAQRDWNNLAPRIGFAWDVLGGGRTVIRGGYGIFYSVQALGQWATESAPPFTQTVQIIEPPSTADPYASYPGGNPFPYVAPSDLSAVSIAKPVVANAVDLGTRTGYAQHWNFTVEQQLFPDTAISIGYVGNHAVKIMSGIEANPAVYGSGATVANTNSRRIFPGFASVALRAPYQFANYHSLQLSLTKRVRRGLTLLGNYVFSKAIDNASGTFGSVTSPRNPLDLSLSRGRSDFDVTHQANIAFVYDIPMRQFENSVARTLLTGWQANGILVFQSGLPFTVLSGRDNSLSGVNGDHADLIGDPRRPAGADRMEQWFNTGAFRSNALGTFGTSGRNILEGPGLVQTDLSLFKSFRLSERLNLQLRAETFNAFNRVNLGRPTNSLTNPNLGKVTTANTDPRVWQGALKLVF